MDITTPTYVHMYVHTLKLKNYRNAGPVLTTSPGLESEGAVLCLPGQQQSPRGGSSQTLSAARGHHRPFLPSYHGPDSSRDSPSWDPFSVSLSYFFR